MGSVEMETVGVVAGFLQPAREMASEVSSADLGAASTLLLVRRRITRENAAANALLLMSRGRTEESAGALVLMSISRGCNATAIASARAEILAGGRTGATDEGAYLWSRFAPSPAWVATPDDTDTEMEDSDVKATPASVRAPCASKKATSRRSRQPGKRSLQEVDAGVATNAPSVKRPRLSPVERAAVREARRLAYATA
ncbi:unnamed protein product [Diplocarpon coronariae]|uniref:Uncharacterized protein n=1 Tax=Diplocarpon coronariae TaxID=2795749 RepID=A0A218Z4G4_9HELO|nr:hypothetical protein JHW43_002189 [Diplocarpon mali]OWP02907.1 hypothetical protein B2J93_3487 [Marssonina coronariae]